MPPKEQKSKKAVREKSAQRMDDATFGLKNKNKSKKVQTFISRVEKGVKHSDGSAAAQQNKQLKKESKAAKLLEEEELRQLLGEGLMGQHGKKVSDMTSTAESLGLTEVSEEVQQLLDEFSSDSDSEEERKEKRKTIYLSSDDEAGEGAEKVFREKTIEDIIEDQRRKLAEEGVPGTPITESSFAEWKKRKEERRAKELEERVKAEQTKKKGGKGLSVLSGKELFKFDSSLFKDDDAAVNRAQEIELMEGIKLDKEQEAAIEARELLKAQAEQDRLMEAEKLEKEARRLKDEERRRVAALKEDTFELGGIVINEAVFDEDDNEDLRPFEDMDTDSDEEEEEEED
jgi:hypothetical protein